MFYRELKLRHIRILVANDIKDISNYRFVRSTIDSYVFYNKKLKQEVSLRR